MQSGDTVGALGESQPHDGHVEHAGGAAFVGLGTEREEPLDRDTLHGQRATEVELDERGVEAVDAGGHRGVGREDGRGAHRLEGLLEGHGLGTHQLADPLDAQEARVALVGVVDVRGRRAGEARPEAQRPDPAHAEQHLLLQAQLPAATVEAFGHAATSVVVAGHVGVEQEQGHPADLGAPDVGLELTAAGQRQADQRRCAVLLAQQREGQSVGVQHGIGLLLPALAVQALAEVARRVEEPHPDDRHPDVGGGLEVVTGEDPQATGILRQRGGDAELGAEVGDGRGHLPVGLLAAPLLVPAVLTDIAVQGLLRVPNRLDELLVRGQAVELVGRDRREHRDGSERAGRGGR